MLSIKEILPLLAVVLVASVTAATSVVITCDDVKVGHFIPNPGKCREYFQCLAGGYKHPGICPEDYNFHFGDQLCDHKDNLPCVDDVPVPSTPEPTTTTEEPEETTQEPEETTEIETTTDEGNETTTEEPNNDITCDDVEYGMFIPDPENCAGYFQCLPDGPDWGECEEPYYFSFWRQLCDYASLVECSIDSPEPTEEAPVETTTDDESAEETTTEEEIETTTVERPLVECPYNRTVYVPHPEQCSQYIFCYYGNPMVRSCSPKYHFNEEKQTCLPRENADCRLQDPTCPEEDDIYNPVFHPNPHYCDQYFLCYNGGLIPFHCENGDHWDPVAEWCYSSNGAECEL